jgi:hypothetical protein
MGPLHGDARAENEGGKQTFHWNPFRRASCNGAAILEKPVSDRRTLGGLTQFASSQAFRSRKLLIVNGEMSEWLKEHAWKTIVVTLAKRY